MNTLSLAYEYVIVFHQVKDGGQALNNNKKKKKQNDKKRSILHSLSVRGGLEWGLYLMNYEEIIP